MAKLTNTLGLQLTSEARYRLSELAAADDRSVSNYVRRIVTAHIREVDGPTATYDRGTRCPGSDLEGIIVEYMDGYYCPIIGCYARTAHGPLMVEHSFLSHADSMTDPD